MADRAVRSGFDGTVRLAERVLDGEVVFFVGSGFSIDSEKNDAKRLVGRLLAAVLAMATILEKEPPHPDKPPADQGTARPPPAASSASTATQQPKERRNRRAAMTDANLRLLAREYYNFNDWAASALTVCLAN